MPTLHSMPRWTYEITMERGGSGDDRVPLDPEEVLPFLHRFRKDPFVLKTFRGLLREFSEGADLARAGDDRVLEMTARMIRAGWIRVYGKPLERGGGGAGEGGAPAKPASQPAEQPTPTAWYGPEEEEPEEEAPPPPPPAVDTSHWVAFQVVDEESGAPVAGVTLSVKLPSGEVRELTTDGTGRIEIQGVDPGSCEIERMTDDDALEVTDVG